MAGSKTELEAFLASEVAKYQGAAVPIRSGFFRRLLVWRLPVKKLHPNPDDVFCSPEIGPNNGIISEYVADFQRNGGADIRRAEEPVIVERIYPDGYMIVNGHHRWAAARKVGRRWINVRIVNLTHELDIRQTIQNSRHSKRVTLDLDEVVFRPETDPHVEPPLRWPLNKIYKEPLRLGVPALFHHLNTIGYDIWLYSSRFYTREYIHFYFKKRHALVIGVVTGSADRLKTAGRLREQLEKLAAAKYTSTIHIDSEAVLRFRTGSRDFEDFRLSGAADTWAEEVRQVIDGLEGLTKRPT